MLVLGFWVFLYSVVVALSIILIGKPTAFVDGMTFIKLLKLLLDWRFILGGILAVGARFIFVIINDIISKTPSLLDLCKSQVSANMIFSAVLGR